MSEQSVQSNLQKVFESGGFAVTGELGPPKGAERRDDPQEGAVARGAVDAANITDNQTAVVRMSSIAAGPARAAGGRRAGGADDLPRPQPPGHRGRPAGCLGAGAAQPPVPHGRPPDLRQPPHGQERVRHRLDPTGADAWPRCATRASSPTGRNWRESRPGSSWARWRARSPTRSSTGPSGWPRRCGPVPASSRPSASTTCRSSRSSWPGSATWTLLDKVYVMAGLSPLKGPGMAKYMAANVPGIDMPEEVIERMTAAGAGIDDKAERSKAWKARGRQAVHRADPGGAGDPRCRRRARDGHRVGGGGAAHRRGGRLAAPARSRCRRRRRSRAAWVGESGAGPGCGRPGSPQSGVTASHNARSVDEPTSRTRSARSPIRVEREHPRRTPTSATSACAAPPGAPWRRSTTCSPARSCWRSRRGTPRWRTAGPCGCALRARPATPAAPRGSTSPGVIDNFRQKTVDRRLGARERPVLQDLPAQRPDVRPDVRGRHDG